ncbi:hypothetical protein LO772_07945 [Yinghuangia sp. ASG 101]|uniref:hypothetical protein n=1 Tax=Yinghuangia sp. ASG 101 TaxID=2896848 RepID=UPI001E458816|nr:hypothetical protein [Yinghuangia sp. ASG 101]UGQ13525.1 hypothetical protein LO772_07945 [Yinghuangia sp. ASG 101]
MTRSSHVIESPLHPGRFTYTLVLTNTDRLFTDAAQARTKATSDLTWLKTTYKTH